MSAREKETAIVTGGARGIGLAIARKLASRGINVLIADVREELGRESAEQITKDFGVEAVFIRADMRSEDDIKAMVDKAVSLWGRLDWAANNAGVGEAMDDNEDHVTREGFDRLYEICQRGVWLCQKYEAEQMRKQEPRVPEGSYLNDKAYPQRGAIVNTASICGRMTNGMPAYTSAKHGVLGITRTGCLFYGKHGIRVNALSPGVVITPEYLDWKKDFVDDERFAEQASGYAKRCPMKRASDCEEQANVASFLLSGESSFVNGADIVCDGGLTAVFDR
ncbi:hypothetical protein AYO21_08961 [Fonsecaea monophora]|uniref:Uncharacterized protein n=1 Tax=Fonsecaea monophora TaxID=254056 RepID=A0A177EY55_9EURO|nr:hypothetical protein AYO21_08961 [Fonsecaea monophora]KAH0837439.1 2,5-dichloro-2,5-cyclohexadiene-1,4-diol dehydrogenase [Fonsecaea pedrosoi]OAG36888.1 hypothetical protein AYO21_08961 [Fonsecaea monophora]